MDDNISNKSATSDKITFKSYIETCKKQYKSFVFVVAALLAVSILYLIVKQPVYERSSQVLIKEDSNPSSKLTAGLSMIQGMGSILGGSSKVNNELIAMESPSTLLEVIHRLNLDYDYTIRPFLQKITLYGNDLPITVKINGLTEQDDAYMKVKLEQGMVKIYKLRKNKDKYSEEFEGKVNQLIKTPIGHVAVAATKSYTGKEDMTIRVMKSAAVSKLKELKRNLQTSITDELGSAIDLSYKDPVPQRAEDILNTLVQVYNENWMNDENQLNNITINFIDRRLDEIVSGLAKVEGDITRYKSYNKIPDLVETTKLAMGTSNVITGELTTLRGQKESANLMLKYLRARATTNEALPSNLMVDPALAGQIAEYNGLLAQRNRLAEHSNTTNPLVTNLDRQLVAARATLNEGLQNTIKLLDIQIAGLQGLGATNESKANSSPQKAKYLLSTERQQKVQEQLYIFLLQKREETVLSQAFTPYKTRILSIPLGDKKPVSPNSFAVILIAIILGIAIPAFFILMQMNLKLLMQSEE